MTELSSVKSILVSLIESIDMYNYLLRDHHRHTAVIAYQLGNEYGLSQESISQLVLTASIHDIGALYIKEVEQLLYADAVNPEPHEILGYEMLKEFSPFAPLSKIIRHHHITYEEVASGEVNEKEVPRECWFLHLADRIDVLLATAPEPEHAREYVVSEISQRFGTIFLPELEEVFLTLSKSDEFWDNIENTSFHNLLFMSVNCEACTLEDGDMDGLAALFARIVDFKSEWTSNHSKSVSTLAESIGRLCGLSEDRCHELKIAGYLHDIGKIAIPSEVLDKPGALSDDEFKVMRSHATYSSLILSKLDFLKEPSRWASAHHEKRDKTGYPLHISENNFSAEMDILAYSDIFAALAEDRPYRKAMPKNRIAEVLHGFADGKLSPSIFDIITENMDDLYEINKRAAVV